MTTETIALLSAISDQIDDCIEAAKKTIQPKVLSEEETRDWNYPNRRVYEGPHENDQKRRVVKYWPELVPLATLQHRVQFYIQELKGK